MYRKELADGKGMLFDFNPEQEISMWMKNTYVSLDMIFIGANGRILRIAENTCTPFLVTISSGWKLAAPAGALATAQPVMTRMAASQPFRADRTAFRSNFMGDTRGVGLERVLTRRSPEKPEARRPAGAPLLLTIAG
jgi:hypothetical protein